MNRIASERKLVGLTQVQLAKMLHVAESTVVRWEKGGNVPQDKLVEMRSIFLCDLEWILGITNERKSITNVTGREVA